MMCNKSIFCLCFFIFQLQFSVMSVQAELEWESTTSSHVASIFDREVTAKFTFKNNGDTPIEITRMHSSCACTTGIPDKMVYESGEKGEIIATFKLGKRTGMHNKFIKIYTDHSKKPTATLRIQVKIPRYVKFSKKMLVWNLNELNNRKQIRIDFNYEKPVLIQNVIDKSKAFKIQLVEKHKGKSYLLQLTPNENIDIDKDMLSVFQLQTNIRLPEDHDDKTKSKAEKEQKPKYLSYSLFAKLVLPKVEIEKPVAE
ncbi:DUF1573 domain-containing protein [Poriferisphaera sp. WC338]|uniref:DUF1573 domain-containing protein n=1 Tax=Poriferisphaera sp. WC338 TaxID=3425129 RepID=UPI003D814C78